VVGGRCFKSSLGNQKLFCANEFRMPLPTRSLQAQASVLSYIDILQSLSLLCGCMIPSVLLLKRPPKETQAAVHQTSLHATDPQENTP
jgi:hypothetical protein